MILCHLLSVGLSENVCNSPEETLAFGESLGRSLQPNRVLCFFGDLGAGKTTLIKGIVKGYAQYPLEQVNSPTFVYLNIYSGTKTVFHFDLYRLRDADEFLSMGFDEMFTAGGLCCIEWSEKIVELLPPDALKITMGHQGEHSRSIKIEGKIL